MRLKNFCNRLLLMVFMLCFGVSAGAQSFYQDNVRIRGNVSIKQGSGVKASADHYLDIGRGVDSGMYVTRLGPVTGDTAHGPEVVGGILWDRTSAGYWYWDGSEYTQLSRTAPVQVGSLQTGEGPLMQFMSIVNGSGDTSAKYLKVTAGETVYYFRAFLTAP